MQEVEITRAIMDRYYAKIRAAADCDVLVAGGGPSGMVCARDLAGKGLSVVVVEKRLAPGGGVWGGAMCWNEVAIQEEARPIAEELSVRLREAGNGLYTADSVELASSLIAAALRAGATILNMCYVEDIVIEGGRIAGLVVNRTGPAQGQLPVDPFSFLSRATLDATGHDAALAALVARRGLRLDTETGGLMGERAMDASAGERFVVEKTGEAFPGLYVSGMATCGVWGGPRMGPVFGGMLLSGRKVAGLLEKALASGEG